MTVIPMPRQDLRETVRALVASGESLSGAVSEMRPFANRNDLLDAILDIDEIDDFRKAVAAADVIDGCPPEEMGGILDTLGRHQVDPLTVALGQMNTGRARTLARSMGVLGDDLVHAISSGSLLLRGGGIRALPDGLAVPGDLDATGCAQLERIGPLRLTGSLTLRNCVSLQSLPSGLVVGGDLDLRGCGALKELPGDLRVGGRIQRDAPGAQGKDSD
jgi:hypothetical protein